MGADKRQCQLSNQESTNCVRKLTLLKTCLAKSAKYGFFKEFLCELQSVCGTGRGQSALACLLAACAKSTAYSSSSSDTTRHRLTPSPTSPPFLVERKFITTFSVRVACTPSVCKTECWRRRRRRRRRVRSNTLPLLPPLQQRQLGKRILLLKKGALGRARVSSSFFKYIFPLLLPPPCEGPPEEAPKKMPTDRPTTPLPPLFSSTWGARETQKWLN